MFKEEIQALAVLQQALQGHGAALAPLALGAEFLLARLDLDMGAMAADQPGQTAAAGGRGGNILRIKQRQGGQRMLPRGLPLIEPDQRHQPGADIPLRRLPRLPGLFSQQSLDLGGQPVITVGAELALESLQKFLPAGQAAFFGIAPVHPERQQQTVETIECQGAAQPLILALTAALQLLEQHRQGRISAPVMFLQAQPNRLLKRREVLRIAACQQGQAVEAMQQRRQFQAAFFGRTALTVPRLQGRQGTAAIAAQHALDKGTRHGGDLLNQATELRPVATPQRLQRQLQTQLGLLRCALEQRQGHPIDLGSRLQAPVELVQIVLQQEDLHLLAHAGEHLFARVITEQLLGRCLYIPTGQALKNLPQLEGLPLQDRQPQAVQLIFLGLHFPAGARRAQAAAQQVQPTVFVAVATELLQHQVAASRQEADRLP